MADFTINSLIRAQAQETDNFIKSDANGVYTKISYGDLKESILAEINAQIEKDFVIARGYETIPFSSGVGYLSVDLSEWSDVIDDLTITGEFTAYANENGVVASITNGTLSNYTFKLATINTSYNGNMILRYRISAKVSSS